MAQFYINGEEVPVIDHIKSLADDELLDFWEETQFLEKFLEEELSAEPGANIEYERLIVEELQLRSHIGALHR